MTFNEQISLSFCTITKYELIYHLVYFSRGDYVDLLSEITTGEVENYDFSLTSSAASRHTFAPKLIVLGTCGCQFEDLDPLSPGGMGWG